MRAAIDKALSLDPTSAWAHALNGGLLATYVRDYPAGEEEYLKSIALDSTAPLAGDYGWLLHARGLDDSALAVARRARRHNPFAGEPLNLAWTIFSNLGMLDSATAACEALRRLARNTCDERVLIQRGRAAEVVAARKARPPTDPLDMVDLAEALAGAGDTVAAHRQLSARRGHGMSARTTSRARISPWETRAVRWSGSTAALLPRRRTWARSTGTGGSGRCTATRGSRPSCGKRGSSCGHDALHRRAHRFGLPHRWYSLAATA